MRNVQCTHRLENGNLAAAIVMIGFNVFHFFLLDLGCLRRRGGFVIQLEV